MKTACAKEPAADANVRSYRLSLDPALEAFRPELEFACRFLDRCHYLARHDEADLLLHYGAHPPKGAVHVPAALFPNGVSIKADGIHPDFDGLNGIEAGATGPALLPPADPAPGPTSRLGYDALGTIFLMLSRLEERDSPAKTQDRYGRYPAEASISSRCRDLSTPLADIAAKDLAQALTGVSDPPSRTEYKVWLTHDVDRIRGYHTLEHLFKNAVGDVIFRHNPKSAVTSLWRAATSGEPWRACRHIMNLAERYGHTSRFYFMGPTEHSMDNNYLLRSPRLVRQLVDEMVSRGHIIGFHPGAETRRDATEWQRQKAGLESVIGRTVHEGRQHGLLFDAEFTLDMWNDGGMTHELSLGFPAPSGFRSGTCRSHPVYSLSRRRTLEITAVPTAIMDFGLFGGRYRELTVDQAISEAQRIVDTCRTYGGDLVVLYHPAEMRPPRTTFFERLVPIL